MDECADLDLVEATIALWQPRAARELTQEDARQIIKNVSGFFAVLVEWSRAERSELANDTAKTAQATSGDARHVC